MLLNGLYLKNKKNKKNSKRVHEKHSKIKYGVQQSVCDGQPVLHAPILYTTYIALIKLRPKPIGRQEDSMTERAPMLVDCMHGY